VVDRVVPDVLEMQRMNLLRGLVLQQRPHRVLEGAVSLEYGSHSLDKIQTLIEHGGEEEIKIYPVADV
jgi:hypothetical protein